MGYPYIGNSYAGIDARHESELSDANAIEAELEQIGDEQRASILGAINLNALVLTRYGYRPLKSVIEADPELLDRIVDGIMDEDDSRIQAEKRIKEREEENELMKAGL